MPIYEYRCTSCDHQLEKIQKMSDAPLSDCPACGQPALKKLVSAAAFRLKGGGWYETDFKKDGKRNLAGDSESGKSESGKGESGKSESTPASGSDSKTDAKSGSGSDSKVETKSVSKNSGGSDSKKSGSSDKAA
ncbi:MAG: FmdB family zinc ribbon protein [Wenzhouxiangella sp.]